jgi:site-specific recombinase XerD
VVRVIHIFDMKKQAQAKYKLIFNRRNKELNKGDKAPVELEVYFNRHERKYIITKILIEEDQWGTSGRYKDLVKSNHPNYLAFNQYLQGLVSSIQNLEYSLINNGRPFTKQILEDFLNDKHTATDFITFLEEEAEKDKSVANGTLKEWNYTIHVFKEFCGTEGCQFSQFTYTKIVDFDNFLRGKKLKQNTIHKHHKNLLRFVNIAIKKKFLKSDDNPYNDFSSKKVAGTRENISMEELLRIEALVFPPAGFEQISNVRDMFLFAAYTGMRYSDVIDLAPRDIEETEDGLTVRFMQKKVEYSKTIEVVLPLYLLFDGKPQQIAYKFLERKKSSVFPNIVNQLVNRHLKSIAIMARIDTPISFHVARHTFGTLLADITGNPYLIMQLMGHSDIKTSMIYIHQSEERLRRQLKSVNWVIG